MASWLKKLTTPCCERPGCRLRAAYEIMTDDVLVMYVCGFHAQRELANAQKREAQPDLPMDKRDS
jgi:hypothetical protein